MKTIAHLSEGLITNISLWADQDAPSGKNYFDVTGTSAQIGDTVVKGQVVPQKRAALPPMKLNQVQQLQKDVADLKAQVAKLTKGA